MGVTCVGRTRRGRTRRTLHATAGNVLRTRSAYALAESEGMMPGNCSGLRRRKRRFVEQGKKVRGRNPMAWQYGMQTLRPRQNKAMECVSSQGRASSFCIFQFETPTPHHSSSLYPRNSLTVATKSLLLEPANCRFSRTSQRSPCFFLRLYICTRSCSLRVQLCLASTVRSLHSPGRWHARAYTATLANKYLE